MAIELQHQTVAHGRAGFGQYVAIVALCIAAAVTYGILHDQITARVCVEYFTIGHAPVFPTDDPTLLGLGWGVLATWWVGFFLGVPLALVARIGSWPKRSAASLVRPLLVLMLVAAVCALLSGLLGWWLASKGAVALVEPLAARVPAAAHRRFLAAGAAHLASYGAGGIGGVVVIVYVGWWRVRMARRLAHGEHPLDQV